MKCRRSFSCLQSRAGIVRKTMLYERTVTLCAGGRSLICVGIKQLRSNRNEKITRSTARTQPADSDVRFASLPFVVQRSLLRMRSAPAAARWESRSSDKHSTVECHRRAA